MVLGSRCSLSWLYEDRVRLFPEVGLAFHSDMINYDHQWHIGAPIKQLPVRGYLMYDNEVLDGISDLNCS